MSKIVILIFATLVVSTVDASDSTGRLRSVQEELEANLTTEINKLEKKYNTTSPTIMEIARNLSHYDDFMDFKNYDYIRPIWNKVREDTLELRVKALIIGGTEDCDEIVDRAFFEGRSLLFNKYECIAYRQASLRHIADLKTMYERLHDTLIDYRIMMGACARVINTTTEVESVISCIKKIGTEAEMFISEDIPSVMTEIDEMNDLLHSHLDEACMNGFDDYKMLAANLTEEATECYHRLLPITLKPTEAAPTTLQVANEVGAN